MSIGRRKALWIREKRGIARQLLDVLWVVTRILGELLGCADDDELLRGHGQMDLLVGDDGCRKRVQWLNGGKVHMRMVVMLLLWDWWWLDGFCLGDIDKGYLWGLHSLH